MNGTALPLLSLLVVSCGGASTQEQNQADAGIGPLDADATALTWRSTGTWTGYIENDQFVSGSDSIRLTIESDSDGVLTGSVVLGKGVAPAPATDGSRGYPPDLSGWQLTAPLGDYWYEGFAYTMVCGIASPARLRFTIQNFELWTGWCALQIPNGVGTSCLLPGQGYTSFSQDGSCSRIDTVTGEVAPVDCGKANLCVLSRVCMCSSTVCASSLETGGQLRFDLAVSGNSANGSIAGNSTHQGNVRFTRLP